MAFEAAEIVVLGEPSRGHRVRIMTLLAHDRYCDAIELEVRRLRDVVTSGADLSATVPTCPDWSLERLVRHTRPGRCAGSSSSSARRRRRTSATQQVPLLEGPAAEGDPAALDAAGRETGEMLVAALREAGPGTEVWAGPGTSAPASGPAG